MRKPVYPLNYVTDTYLQQEKLFGVPREHISKDMRMETLRSLLEKAVDLFNGVHEMCYEFGSEEYIWWHQCLAALELEKEYRERLP